MITLDCAAAEFFVDGKYDYTSLKEIKVQYAPVRTGRIPTSHCGKYPIISIEDGMDENDWDGWKMLLKLQDIKYSGRR
jgi:enolase